MGRVCKHAGINNSNLKHAAYRKIVNYCNCKFITLKYINHLVISFSHLINLI